MELITTVKIFIVPASEVLRESSKEEGRLVRIYQKVELGCNVRVKRYVSDQLGIYTDLESL